MTSASTASFFDLDDLTCYPKPYGTTHLPIHIGGSSRPAARRAGRRGDGWFAGGLRTQEERRAQMEAFAKRFAM